MDNFVMFISKKHNMILDYIDGMSRIGFMIVLPYSMCIRLFCTRWSYLEWQTASIIIRGFFI